MSRRANLLITGATGFVGQALLNELLRYDSYKVAVALRSPCGFHGCQAYVIGDLAENINWSDALVGQQVIIHTAARVHVMKDQVADPLDAYRKVNVAGTLELAHQAAKAGVKRFIFISSIKVNGEETFSGHRFTADDKPAPSDPYGISKWEAEQGLQQLAAESGMEVVIIRPPLIYGPGVKGNFATMTRLVGSGWPLPFGAVDNKRSLVALGNLVDLIIKCIDHPTAANEIFLASDGVDLSTAELLVSVAKAMGRPSRLFPLPQPVLMYVATLLGKKQMAQRLFGSLQVDHFKACGLLDWEPPISVEEGLRRCFANR